MTKAAHETAFKPSFITGIEIQERKLLGCIKSIAYQWVERCDYDPEALNAGC
jgi:hypothetical protein